MNELRNRLREQVESKCNKLIDAVDRALRIGRGNRRIRALEGELQQVDEWLSEGWEALSELTLARLCEWVAEPDAQPAPLSIRTARRAAINSRLGPLPYVPPRRRLR